METLKILCAKNTFSMVETLMVCDGVLRTPAGRVEEVLTLTVGQTHLEVV